MVDTYVGEYNAMSLSLTHFAHVYYIQYVKMKANTILMRHGVSNVAFYVCCSHMG